MRPPALRIHSEELLVDNFAGGGGASTGIGWALGRDPDIAINHDPEALALHAANHPGTKHFCEDVFAVSPRKACAGKKVALAWFSPDCTFFSKARGGKPFRDRNKARRRRGLAGVVTKWAAQVKPRVIAMENVEEFQKWGPLDAKGRPDKSRAGDNFKRWLSRLRNLGYHVEWRQLRGCDYGAPTTRRRLFMVARCDGQPIVWPEPTHGKGRPLPFRTAAECIDWSIPCKSIFERKKPLAEATLKRIARGLRRYVFEAAEPFVIPLTHHGDRKSHPMCEPLPVVTAAHRGELALVTPYIARLGQTGGNGKYTNGVDEPVTTVTTKAEHMLIAPTMVQTGWGEREGQAPRALDLFKPLGTLMAEGNKHALVAAFLARHYGGHENDGAPLQLSMPTVTSRDHHALVVSHLLKLRGGVEDHPNTAQAITEPIPALTAGGTHIAEVRAFMVAYFGNEKDGAQLNLPMRTVTTKDRFGLVTVMIGGKEYGIVDIGMRMLEPHELFLAQGFNDGYLKPVKVKNKKGKLTKLSKTAQVRLVGNSVCPPVARALVEAQFGVAQARVGAA